MSGIIHNRGLSRRALLAGSAAWLVAGQASAQGAGEGGAPTAAKLAIVGGTLWRADDEPLKDAVVVIDGGKVSYVGTDAAQAGAATTIDAKGQVVTAGLIELFTQIGVEEVSLESSTVDTTHKTDDPVRAAFKTADGYDPASNVIGITRQHGITSANIMPSGGLVPGQSCWVDLDGATPDEAIARDSMALHIDLYAGMFDEGTSRGTAFLKLRELFDDARAYQQNKAGFERRQLRELGASRLDLETVLRALKGELPTIVSVDRMSDILSVLRLAKENGLKLVLSSAAEGWKVAPQIAEAKVPVMTFPLSSGPISFAALGAREDNAALLHKAGVTIAICYNGAHNTRKLRQVAGNAVRAGLPHRAALDAVTDAPARMLGMADYGALQAGRVANLVVWTGDPFELSSHATHVIIRGRDVDLRTRQSALRERYR